MNDITPKEAIANLNHLYGMVAPDMQRSLDVVIKAVERPSGDAISREALRKQMKELLDLSVKRVNDTPNTSPCYRMYVAQENERARLIDLIDNAQAVPLPNEQVAWEQGYEAGLAQGKCERQKGEWKLVERDNQDIDIVCPFCNSIRFPAYSHGYTLEELEEYLIRQHLPKFCEDCGADMRKGDAE